MILKNQNQRSEGNDVLVHTHHNHPSMTTSSVCMKMKNNYRLPHLYLYLYQDMPYDLLKSHLGTTTVVASLLFIFKQKQTMPFVRFLTLSMVTILGLFPSTICGSWLSSPITSMRLFPFSSKCTVDSGPFPTNRSISASVSNKQRRALVHPSFTIFLWLVSGLSDHVHGIVPFFE